VKTRYPITLFLVGLVIGGSVGASAHDFADYPNKGWKYSILNRVFYQSPGSWPSAYNPRTDDAMAKWNAISGNSLSFALAGNAVTNGWSCGQTFDFLKEVQVTPLA